MVRIFTRFRSAGLVFCALALGFSLLVVGDTGSASSLAADFRTGSSCIATRTVGQSSIGSSITGNALEVCLRRVSGTVTEQPPRTSGSGSSSHSVTKSVCTSGTVTIRLGPPTFQVKSYRQTVCGGITTTIDVTNPPPVISAVNSGSRSAASTVTRPGSTGTANSSAQDSAVFQPEQHRISPESAAIVAGTALTFTSLAKVHCQTASILGEQLSVRWVPTEFHWTVDGPAQPVQSGAGAKIEMTFKASGSYGVQVTVLFQPEYELAGLGYWVRADQGVRSSAKSQITVDASIVQPPVTQPTPSLPPLVSRGHARLAASDCLANPKGRGCTR